MNELGVLKDRVRFFTSHVDGKQVFWASRFDLDLDSGKFLNWQNAGPFDSLKAAKAPFGKETRLPK